MRGCLADGRHVQPTERGVALGAGGGCPAGPAPCGIGGPARHGSQRARGGGSGLLSLGDHRGGGAGARRSSTPAGRGPARESALPPELLGPIENLPANAAAVFRAFGLRRYRRRIGIGHPWDCCFPRINCRRRSKPRIISTMPIGRRSSYCAGGGERGGWQELSGPRDPAARDPSPWRRMTPSGPPLAAGQSRRDASGHEDSHTWSSLLLDEGDDHATLLRGGGAGTVARSCGCAERPWMVLARSGSGWHVDRNPDRRGIRAAIDSPLRRCARSGRVMGSCSLMPSAIRRLNAADTRRYWTELLPKTAAEVLRRHAPSIVLRKTWGDAVHAVFRTASAAAAAALEIQAATAKTGGRARAGQAAVIPHRGSLRRRRSRFRPGRGNALHIRPAAVFCGPHRSGGPARTASS